ncbi:hypothetical protein [Enterococcus lemanii]|uniref:Uncharacterized protein n=1 Tax=Enterococcus lemanii TaxID=1159752 RepID=A0ABV9MSK5_9ENTE|nr:hypothetical protein [Enterococcus lemanii]MBM7708641.1 hypothetical protein [Enterococcus lemanii]
MSEYYYILSLYQKHKRYELKVIFFSLLILVITSCFVWLDLFRIEPIFIYFIGMLVSCYYAYKIRVESKNYQKLLNFLKNNEEISDNKELVFFIDYQLDSYFKQESTEIWNRLTDGENWNVEKSKNEIHRIIQEIINYYEFLTLDERHDQNIELSLDWYRESIEKRKKDLI